MILLDTHVWIWWLSNPEWLSKKAERAINNTRRKDKVLVSSISVWEVAFLVQKKRLELTMDVQDWVRHSESIPFIGFVPVDNDLALKAVSLPEPLHNDPADRTIISTSLRLGIPLVTKDKKLQDYPHVETIW